MGVETVAIDYQLRRYEFGDVVSGVGDFDAFLLQFGANFPLPIVRAIQRPKVFYCSELVNRFQASDHLFRSQEFDLYLVRGPRCAAELDARGWVPPDRIRTFLSAFDPLTYAPRNVAKDIDVVFVGSLLPRRRRILDRLAKSFSLVTANAYGPAANSLFNRARVVINVHAEDYLDTETRVFEVLGAGGCLVTEKLGAENPFLPGTDLIETESVSDMEEAISDLLSNEARRESTANAGHEAALRSHTYLHRAHELKGMLEDLCQSRHSIAAINEGLLSRYRRGKHLRRVRAFIEHKHWQVKQRLGRSK